MAAKTTSKTQKAKPRNHVKASAVTQRPTYAELCQELEGRNRDLTESLQRENATSEILRVIASSAQDLQKVLDAVAENAARLCEAKDSLIFRIEGDFYQRVAKYGSMYTGGTRLPITFRTPIGRAMLDRQTIHVHDMKAEEIATQYPDSETIRDTAGTRT